MPHFYAATNLRDKSARTGARRWRVLAFTSRADRDAFVRNYPTNDCRAVQAGELTTRERAWAKARTDAVSEPVTSDA